MLVSWDQFVATFENQYFLESVRDQFRMQFELLQQGNMSVSEYSIKFQSLSRFAPDLVVSEDRKCRRFEKGLCPSLQKLVMGHHLRSFDAILDYARAVEPVRTNEERKVSMWEPRQQSIGSDSRSSSGSLGRKSHRDQRHVISQ